MAGKGFWGRIVGAIESIFRFEPEPEPSGPTHIPEPEPPETYEYPQEPESFSGYYREGERAPSVYEPEDEYSFPYPMPPREYGPEPEYEEIYPGFDPRNATAEQEWDHLSWEYDIQGNPYMESLLWDGWFNDSLSFEDRQAARDSFYIEMGWDHEDNDGFDWREWRDWYGTPA